MVCTFDAVGGSSAAFNYSLAGQNLTGFPGPQRFTTDGPIVSVKYFATAVVTAQAQRYALQLHTQGVVGKLWLDNLTALVEPLGRPSHRGLPGTRNAAKSRRNILYTRTYRRHVGQTFSSVNPAV